MNHLFNFERTNDSHFFPIKISNYIMMFSFYFLNRSSHLFYIKNISPKIRESNEFW